MTWVEYGKLRLSFFNGRAELGIVCELPDKLLEIVSQINDCSLQMEVRKNNMVFVNIPRNLLE